MEINTAVVAMSALAQGTRLEAFRLLISAGPGGMPAGEIASALQVPHNTLSTHLGTLVHSGLMQSKRVGRSIFYSVDEEGVRSLLQFLLQDCCKGRPELCMPNSGSSRRRAGEKPRTEHKALNQ